LFIVFFLLVAVQGEVTIHPCEILLICPAEACHAPIFNGSSAIITLIYPTPDSIFSLVSEISGAVIARLINPIALTDIVVTDASAIVGPTAAARVLVRVLDEGSVAWVIAP